MSSLATRQARRQTSAPAFDGRCSVARVSSVEASPSPRVCTLLIIIMAPTPQRAA